MARTCSKCGGRAGPLPCPVCEGRGAVGLELLSGLALEVLRNLPTEPVGLSLPELADGLLEDASPRGLGLARIAKDQVAAALGRLYMRQGDDDLGHADVRLYGVAATDRGRVNAFFARRRL